MLVTLDNLTSGFNIATSYSKYEAVVDLKYMSKEKTKEENKEQLLSKGKQQLERYLEDKRLAQRANLKKYVIIFTGFEDVIVEEININKRNTWIYKRR